jgi:hypothetical protein
MAEPTPEKPIARPSFERSRDLSAVVAATIEATRKIGAAITKAAQDIIGMIFK